jgi:hypothetical protein
VAAEWDSSGYDSSPDTVKISETSPAADAAYDTDPDIENYAAGNNPETAYRDQGRTDGPNSWSSYTSDDNYEANGYGDHAGGAYRNTGPRETYGTSESDGYWDGADPDAEAYADLDRYGIDGAGVPDSPGQGEPGPDGDLDSGRPGQGSNPERDYRDQGRPGSPYDGNTDTVNISEASPALDAAYDADPDIENYAAGNNPETAYRDQDRTDGPNSWSSYTNHDNYQGNKHGDDAAEGTGPRETGSTSQRSDLWGDTDPDAQNYADIDRYGASRADLPNSPGQGEPSPVGDVDSGRPDQAQPGEAGTERELSPEQQRISALEADNAGVKQRLADATQETADAKQEAADANQEAADAKQQVADLKADLKTANDAQTARMDRFEQLLARSDRPPDTAEAHEHDEPKAPADQHRAPDTANNEHRATIAEHKDTRHGTDAQEAKRGWRLAASAENVAFASGAVTAADSFAQVAMHATPDGVAGLGAAVLGLASLGIAKLEKHRKAKP